MQVHNPDLTAQIMALYSEPISHTDAIAATDRLVELIKILTEITNTTPAPK